MAQVKIYGRRSWLATVRTELSDMIHSCAVDALSLPSTKRFHRFIMLEEDDFVHPSDRSERYTILEFSMFEGRTREAKKKLIALLYQRASTRLELAVDDLEITIVETPRENWGIRGMPGDELNLSYRVDV